MGGKKYLEGSYLVIILFYLIVFFLFLRMYVLDLEVRLIVHPYVVQGDEDRARGGARPGDAELPPVAGQEVLVPALAEDPDLVTLCRSSGQRSEVRTGAVTLAHWHAGGRQA